MAEDIYQAALETAPLDRIDPIVTDPSDENMRTFGASIGPGPLAQKGPAASGTPRPESLRYALLRFLVDEERSRINLQGLVEKYPTFDRDRAVLTVWQKIADEDSEYVRDHHFSIIYHERRLFAWFVDRYDLLRARHIYSRSFWLSRMLQFAPLVGAALGLLLLAQGRPAWVALAVLLSGYALALLVWRLRGFSALDFAQSLVPRLAGTAAAGAGLLLSASDFLRFLCERMTLSASAALLVAAALYLVLEIQHRVYPRLRTSEVLRRVVAVIALALTHAAAIIIAVVPAIRVLIIGAGATPFESFSITQLVAFTTAVFSGGLVLNVIWAEEPITRPL